MKLESGQVAVVTGGASGIGFALARAFGQKGLRLVVADVQFAALENAASRLRNSGFDVLAVATDVSDAVAVQKLADNTLEHFGRVDVVCNNAGISGPLGRTWEQELSSWRWQLDVMVMGLVHGVRSFVPHLVAQGTGHVVNTASIGGLMPLPQRGPYNAAKHAVVGLTETLDEELRSVAPAVGASVLCPSLTDTQLAVTSLANRPSDLKPRADELVQTMDDKAEVYGAVQSAEDVAIVALEAIESRKLHAVPSPDSYRFVRARVDRLLRDLT